MANNAKNAKLTVVTLQLNCPECGDDIAFNDEYVFTPSELVVGQKAKCDGCGETCRVPKKIETIGDDL